MSTHVLIAKSVLTTTAAWRERVYITHPNDDRNPIARQLLERIAADPVGSVPAETIEHLSDYSENEFATHAMATARAVGFRIFAGSLMAFLIEVMRAIDKARAEIDAEFSGGAK